MSVSKHRDIDVMYLGPNAGMKAAGVAAAGLLGGLVLGEVVEHHHDTGRW